MSKSMLCLTGLWLYLAAIAPAQNGTALHVQIYNVAGAGSSWGIAAGPDGALWFTEATCTANCVGRIATTGAITLFSEGCRSLGIAAGSDGALWYTETCNAIGRITTDGAITEYPLPSSSGPYAICSGPDGALWFTDAGANQIGRMTTTGDLTEYAVPTPGSDPSGITAGPDGALWFTEGNKNKIGRITTAGEITEYLIPRPLSEPNSITAGPDGALWFIGGSSAIGRISTTGAVKVYPLPPGDGSPEAIVTGPDGALWFTMLRGSSPNGIGRMTTTGFVTEYPAETLFSEAIVVGPDGNLWFTGLDTNGIGRAPACGLGLSASFKDHTLTMNFELGIDTPAEWKVRAGTYSLNRPIRAVVPPKPLTLRWRDFPNEGGVQVKSTLSDESGGALCSEWANVITGK